MQIYAFTIYVIYIITCIYSKLICDISFIEHQDVHCSHATTQRVIIDAENSENRSRNILVLAARTVNLVLGFPISCSGLGNLWQPRPQRSLLFQKIEFSIKADMRGWSFLSGGGP